MKNSANNRSRIASEVNAPAVIVTGNFMDKGGFAQESLKEILDIHNRTSRYFGRTAQPIKNSSASPDKEKVRTGVENRFLEPVEVNDRGDASSLEFRRDLYAKFNQFNIWGVISCSTAQNCSELLNALDPIDVPILIALDNTVKRSNLSNPNLLQLIPNNALQAQAILSKVASEVGETGDHNVYVYCSPPQDYFVRDLLKALKNKANDSQNHRIRLKEIAIDAWTEVGLGLKSKDILIYVGYSEGLRQLERVTAPKLILCDGCNEPNAQNEMSKMKKRAVYFVARPSYEPWVYACQAYLSLNDVWLDTKLHGLRWSPEKRAQSLTSRMRLDLEEQFSDRYTFVGSANQSGGYVIREMQTSKNPKTTSHDVMVHG